MFLVYVVSVCLCVVHEHECTGMSSYVYECSCQSRVSGIYLYCVLFIASRHSFSLNQELAILARVADQRAFGMYLPPPPIVLKL